MSYSGQNIRNVCLLGHSGSGKLDSCRLIGQVFPQLGKDLIFQGSQPIPGPQDLVFQLLQLGPLGLDPGLLLLCQRLKILHIAEIICHHSHITQNFVIVLYQ